MSSNDKKLDAIKTLYKSRRVKAELQQDLIDLTARVAKQEEAVAKYFSEGIYTIDRFVVKITKRLNKGRATPAWKKISEAIESFVEQTRDRCVSKWNLDAPTADRFRNEVINKIPNIRKQNTNIGDDKTVIEVEIEKVKSEN
jgi:hypothetical protein